MAARWFFKFLTIGIVSPSPYGRVTNVPLLSSPLDGGLISRAPKGDGGLNSRACLRILSMAALTVEHLKVMAASRACLRILSSPLWSST